MACSKKLRVNTSPAPDMVARYQEPVLVLMRYKGLFEMDEYTGEGSGQEYKFGLLRLKGYVDGRDVPGLLATFEDGLPVFEVLDG